MKTILVNAPASEPVNDDQTHSDNLDVLEEAVSLPEKYRGKSAAEIAQMHMEAEKEKGRLGNELGEVRKLADTIIRQQLTQASKETKSAPVERKEITADELLEAPQKVIDDAVAAHPALRRAEELERSLVEQQVNAQVDAFAKKHPDYREIGQSPEFLDWVKATPGRQKLYAQASNYDFDVADELLTQFKDNKAKVATAAAKTVRKDEIRARAKDATLETATSGDASKKVYRRKDLLDMMVSRPDKYYDETFQSELQKAYVEGRVK